MNQEKQKAILVLIFLIIMSVTVYALHGWRGVGYLTIAYCALIINGLTRYED